MTPGKLHRIVLTGGPCAGKTTALVHAREHLEKLGIKTFVVPEVATMLINGGVDFSFDPDEYTDIQKSMLRLQLTTEDAFLKRARQLQRGGFHCAVIYDRGAMDFAAYNKPEEWLAMLDEMNFSVIGLRDRAYDGIIHMMTAALGAEEFYTTENNTARRESPEQAAALDRRVMEAWTGHPHLSIIGNEGGFEAKLKMVVAALSRIVGIPEPLEIERRFLVGAMGWRPGGPLASVTTGHHDFTVIEQCYLGKGHRIRQRGRDSHYAYSQTVKSELRPGVRREDEWAISSGEYFKLRRQLPSIQEVSGHPMLSSIKPVIKKVRQVFVWENQVFELDTFNDPCGGMSILECETATEATPINLPPFIQIDREVTDDHRYSNYSIAMNRHV